MAIATKEQERIYYELINIPTLDEKANIKIRKQIIKDKSILPRLVDNITTLKYGMTFDHLNTFVTVCKLYNKGYEAIYAILYSEYEESGGFINKYCTVSGTLSSQDGEYRNILIPFETFVARFKEHDNIFTPIMDEIAHKWHNSETFDIRFRTYPPLGYEYVGEQYAKFLMDSQIHLRLLAMAWFLDYSLIRERIGFNHLNGTYKILIQSFGRKLYNDIRARFKNRKQFLHLINTYISEFNPQHRKTAQVIRLHCGQKSFPVTQGTLKNKDDINFDLWRELFIGQLAADLVINCISPCFPVVGDWVFTQNATTSVFDNDPIYRKYDISKTAARQNELIKEAEKLVIERGDVDNIEDAELMSDSFRTTIKLTQRAMARNEKQTLFSSIVINIASENVGRTFGDITDLAGYDTLDPQYFPKYLFDLIYSLQCLNECYGIIHGDLHTNNITIHKYTEHKAHTLYSLGGNNFLLPSNGEHGCIIDFSRAIITHEDTLMTRIKDRNQVINFINDQRMLLFQLLNTHFPFILERYERELTQRINSSNLAFKCFFAIDTFILTTNMLSVLDDYRDRYDAKIFTLLTHVKQFSANLLATNFSRIMNQDYGFEYPNFVILRECFGEYLIPEGEPVPNVPLLGVFTMKPPEYKITEFTRGILSVDEELKKDPIPAEYLRWYNLITKKEDLHYNILVSKFGTSQNYKEHLPDWKVR